MRAAIDDGGVEDRAVTRKATGIALSRGAIQTSRNMRGPRQAPGLREGMGSHRSRDFQEILGASSCDQYGRRVLECSHMLVAARRMRQVASRPFPTWRWRPPGLSGGSTVAPDWRVVGESRELVLSLGCHPAEKPCDVWAPTIVVRVVPREHIDAGL